MSFIPLCNVAKLSNSKDAPKIGKVINISDPLGQQRIKVSLEGIYDPADEEGTNLPWIRQMRDTFLNSNGRQAFSVPQVGSPVEIIWPYDDKNAYYRGCAFSEKSVTTAFTSPVEWGWADNYGVVLKMSAGSIVITNQAGTVVVDAAGNITITGNNMGTTAQQVTENYSQLTTSVSGDINTSGANITLSGNVNISGGTVNITGGSCSIDGYNFLQHKHTSSAPGSPTSGVVA